MSLPLSNIPQSIISIPSLTTSVSTELALTSLKHFSRQAWSLIEPSTQFSWNWHLDEMSSVCNDIKSGKLKRVVFNIPPGCSKSILINVMFPSWLWTADPGLRFLTFSFSDVNTIRDNRRARDIVTSPWFKQLNTDFSLSTDQAGKIRFDTTRKGYRIASSVGGMGIGEHPDYIIIDDPLKADDARSDVEIENNIEWFKRTIPTRVMRDPAIILIMQRLHLNDLSAYLLSTGQFEHVCFPMHYLTQEEIDAENKKELENNRDEDTIYLRTVDKRDHRTVSGELLWPEKWSEEKIKGAEVILGPFGSAAQLEQWPIPEGGGLFKWEWFEFVDSLPLNGKFESCRGWDTADTEAVLTKKGKVSSKGDWTVGVKLTVDRRTGVFYVEHVIREKVSSLGVDRLIKTTAEMDGRKCKIREGEGSGKATTNKRVIDLAGYDYDISPEKEDKVARAGPFRSQCNAGNVKIIKGPWNQAYLSVLTSFPVGRYDDDVDGSSNSFNELAVNVKKKGRVTW